MDDLIKALTILRKYGNPSYPTQCEHDVLYVFIDYDSVSDEDKETLDGLGFIKNTDGGQGFMSFKYGG